MTIVVVIKILMLFTGTFKFEKNKITVTGEYFMLFASFRYSTDTIESHIKLLVLIENK